MLSIRKILVILFSLLIQISTNAFADDEISQAMIKESISAYSGHCPCPYNFASNGSHCGRRSAYSKPGGHLPLCYAEDITPQMINEYRRKH